MSPTSLKIDSDPGEYLALHGSLDEQVADARLTRRELEVRERTREVVAHEVAPRAVEADLTHAFADESFQALARAGLGGLVFPESLGGTGDTNVAYAVAMEEVAAGCAATSLIFMTQMHAAYPIYLAGSRELQQRYVPGILSGALYGSLAITEPEAGSDVSSLKTVARRVPSGWSIRGQKTFITTGDRSDVIVCFATIDKTRHRDGITAFVIEGHPAGLTRGRPFQKMGMHGSSTAELFLDDVRVPHDHLLGEEGHGWSMVMRSVVKSRISAAAQGVGLARTAYARTLAFLTSRHGRRLPDEQLFALAGLRGCILQGRLLLHAVAHQADLDPDLSSAQIGMMKQSCTDLGFDAAVEAARILGPYGDLADIGVERCIRDAKVTQIYDGTNEIQRLLIGRDVTRRLRGST